QAVAWLLAGGQGELVYAIGDGRGLVKIGKTGGKHPVERMRELQTGCPTGLTLLGYTHGSERAYHRLLSSLHVRGEWFMLTAWLLDLIGRFDWVDEDALAVEAFRIG